MRSPVQIVYLFLRRSPVPDPGEMPALISLETHHSHVSTATLMTPLSTDHAQFARTRNDAFPHPRRWEHQEFFMHFLEKKSSVLFLINRWGPTPGLKLLRNTETRALPFSRAGLRGHRAPSKYLRLEAPAERYIIGNGQLRARHMKIYTGFRIRLHCAVPKVNRERSGRSQGQGRRIRDYVFFFQRSCSIRFEYASRAHALRATDAIETTQKSTCSTVKALL